MAQQKLYRMRAAKYADLAFSVIEHLIEDVAAICKQFLSMLRRCTGKTSTVRSSLIDAFSPGKMGQVCSLCRSNPDVATPTGTTANEAFANQLKSWFRNVNFQKGRNAVNVLGVATL